MSITVSASYLFEFKAAVHLNNAGVSLLQRDRCDAAVKCFTDAISVMMIASSSSPSNAVDNTDKSHVTPVLRDNSHYTDIQGRLQEAAKMLSRTEPSVDSATENSALVEVVSDLVNPCITARSILQVGPTRLIRIEPVDFEIPSEKEMAVESSIILYNYAMAFLWFASRPALSLHRERFLNEVFRLLSLSYATMNSLYTSEQPDVSVQLNRAVVTSLLVLRELSDLASQLGMSAQNEEYMRRLTHLRNFAQRMTLEKCGLTPTAAGAA